MGLFQGIFHKKKEVEHSKNYELKRLALKKLKTVQKKKFSTKSFEEFVFILRVFNEKVFKLKKTLTYEETQKEIKTKKIKLALKNKIVLLLKKVEEIEFGNHRIDREKLDSLISELKEIIEKS